MNPLIASMVGPRGAKQFARTTNRSLGDLDAAKRLLGGRRWSELPREDKLEIRRNTGWQLGPGGDWLYETDADPVLTPAFNERFSPWLEVDKGFSAALKTLYDTVESLKAEESAIANSWNERHPRNLYSSLLPHVYNPSYAPRGFAAESALSDYDSAVKFAARLREDGLVDTRDKEMYRSAKRFLDRPKLSKAIAELSNAMKRAKKTEFKPFAGKLSDMVDLSADPEFAVAYPDLKDIDVAIVDGKDPEFMGSFSAKDNKLTITKRNLQKHGISGALRTALHELAHARQAKEGAAPGGDDMTYIVDSPPGRDLLGAYRERLTRMEDTLANGSWLAKQLLGGPETLRNRIDVYRRTLAFLDKERSRFDQIAARADQADDKSPRKYYLYRRLAGEVDARNAETRQGLDPEARSSTLLEDTEDIPRRDQIDARFGVVPGRTVSKAATVLDEHPYILQQDAKGGDTREDAKDVRRITYEDLRKLADATYKGDIRAAVYSLDPKVVTATVDSFGGNIDRTNRPMYVHRDKDGKITGYSTTNSGDALDRGVKPEGRFQSVLVPFVRQGKDGPEYTEDYNVAQKWYDESGQHYGKFDMDFTTPEAKARSIDRFNAASWLVHREQQLRYQPEFDKLVEAERRQAAKAGDAGHSKSSGVPSGHNPALDGYSGPRVVINPSTFRNEKDGLCIAFNESFRIIQEINGFDPVAEPTEKQRAFFADTAYNDDERMLRRTILARICTFDTSVTDPTDEQLQEAVEFLDTVLEIGAPQNQWEQRAVERIRTAISRALESGERVPASQAPAPEDSPEVAAGGAGSSAGGVPKDEEKDSGAEFRENARAQMDEAAKLAQEGPTAEEQKTQAMAEAAGESAGDDPFGKSAEMKAAAQEAGIKADIAEAQKPESLMQKNGHYVDAQGRVISERAAKALAEQGVRNSAAQDTNNQQQAPEAGMDAAQNSPRTDSERIGVSSGIKGPDGRELTAGEAAWMARRQASTAAWMQRTGRSGNGVADALAQRDEHANGLFQNRQTDSGRRGALGRKLDDRGRVIA